MAENAEKEAEQKKREERKTRKQARQAGEKQYKDMSSTQQAPINAWKDFTSRSGGSGSTSEPSAADTGASETQTGGAQSTGKRTLALRKNKEGQS